MYFTSFYPSKDYHYIILNTFYLHILNPQHSFCFMLIVVFNWQVLLIKKDRSRWFTYYDEEESLFFEMTDSIYSMFLINFNWSKTFSATNSLHVALYYAFGWELEYPVPCHYHLCDNWLKLHWTCNWFELTSLFLTFLE